MTREISLVKHGFGGFFKKYILAINVYRKSSFSMVNHQHITYKFTMFHIYSELKSELTIWTCDRNYCKILWQRPANRMCKQMLRIYSHILYVYIYYTYMIIYSYLDILGDTTQKQSHPTIFTDQSSSDSSEISDRNSIPGWFSQRGPKSSLGFTSQCRDLCQIALL